MRLIIRLFLLSAVFLTSSGICKDHILKILLYEGPIKNLTIAKNRLRVARSTIQFGKSSYPFNGKYRKIRTKSYIVFKKHKYTGLFSIATKGSRVRVINFVGIEQYLPGVLAGEISHTWPREAIKAQAVAARSYAYATYIRNKNKPYHINAGVSSQVFTGTYHQNPILVQCVRDTSRTIITYRGKPVQTFFTASCGGETERALDVWPKGEGLDYLQNIRCHYCMGHPKYTWEHNISFKDTAYKLRRYLKKGESISDIRIGHRTRTGRIRSINIKTRGRSISIKGNKFRLLIGANAMLSLKAKLRCSGRKLFLSGTGFGHGVGFCQWGAKTLAEKNRTYQTILSYYYKNIRYTNI